MTQFERSLIKELQGIKKELQKLNKNNDDKKVKIPPPEDILKMQLENIVGQMNQQSKKVEENEKKIIEDTTYDPLSNR